MDAEKMIKVKAADGKLVELSTKAATKSSVLKGLIEDYPENDELPLPENTVNGNELEKIKDYLMHYQDVEEPPKIPKPLKSNEFKECCVDEWDYNFVGDNNNEILALIRAANYLDIKPLLELLSAKVACKIRGTTTESIRKDFGIENINKDEEAQINADKKYLEENL